jgi:flagellar basal body-associated protein FliL
LGRTGKSGSRYILKYILPLAAGLLIAGLVVINNCPGVLRPLRIRDKEKAGVEPELPTSPAVALTVGSYSAPGGDEGGEGAAAETPAVAGEEDMDEPAPARAGPPAAHVIPLHRVRCPVAVPSGVEVLVSCDIVVTGGAAYDEVMLKRENLKIMIVKTMRQKSPDDLDADELKKELQAEMNAILENGPVADIEFTGFEVTRTQ